jgi:hypothetical protein
MRTFDWASAEGSAALALAQSRKPRNTTDFQAAEMILLAKDMLFYTQARLWSEDGPVGVKVPPTFTQAAQYIVRIVDLGYNAEHKQWWYMGDWPEAERRESVLLLMDFGLMLKQLRQNTFVVAAASFDVFLDIVLGRNWERRYAQFLRNASASLVKQGL